MKTTKRVAVAAGSGLVSPHFGRCSEYVIADLDPVAAASGIRWTLPNPGHEPALLPRLLAQNQVDVIIAGGMGLRAQAMFEQSGISAIIGASGTVESVLEAFADGTLQLGASACDHIAGEAPHGREV